MVSPVFIRPALAILVTTAIICIVIAISRNGSNHPAPVQSVFQQLPQNIDIALKQARFSEIKDGSVVWELVAEKVEYDKSGEIAHLAGGIRMNFVKNSSRGAIKVTADNGEYQGNRKIIKLRGKVHVLTEEGASFETDSIDYMAAASQFKTAGMVVFRDEKLTLNAIGMQMGVKEQQARFLKLVDATVAGTSLHGAK
ncbi:MAG: LPS export ABC transporter periplasmic protein LptC [Desulfuromonadaceae bacterium]|nr:LPS export ABC transporter periplasmic protein LptC [Desulfuromonadaceae bacterium]